ncbi:MAG: response regulator transcription factor [Woeseiaceae bacterium]|nr:response regulator transcription factor [Woeseiaceae bacterium]
MTADNANAHAPLIDDDRQLSGMIRDYLEPERLRLSTCDNGEDGLEMLAGNGYDLLVLDIMLPGMTGLDVLRKLRQVSDIPVIMLTARGDDVDRIIGLEIGADDYLPKPFNPRELTARIKAILRRAQQPAANDEQTELGNVRLNPRTRVVTVADTELRLTGTEFEVLRCLLESAGEVVSKEALSERALGRRLLPDDRSIDTHISNLRGKLERAGSRQMTIRNQRGIGYVLVPGA